jgi:integrase
MARKRQARANGEGTLEMHGRTWRARWTVDGKTFTRSTGTSDKREAARRLAEFTAPFRLGNERATLEGIAARVQGVTAELKAYHDAQPALALADGFEAYRTAEIRPDSGTRTMAGYECYYNGLLSWLAANRPAYREMREVTPADAQAFAADFMQGHSAGTFNKHITFLKCLWRTVADADADGASGRLAAKLAGNPWERIRTRAHEPHARRELTVDELARVCAAVEGEMRTLFAVGIYTGLRLGDAARLDWGNVDLMRGMIAVIPRKTARHAHGKRTVIPIHPTLAGMLADTPPDGRKGYVMPSLAAMHERDSSMLTNRVKAVFEGCGIATTTTDENTGRAMVDVGFHSLRHTFVSLSANAGTPLAVVQAIVGHSSAAMTRHYYHESAGALKNAVAALPDVTGAVALPDGADAPQAVPCAFCAALDGMSLAQLEAARAEIDRRISAIRGT